MAVCYHRKHLTVKCKDGKAREFAIPCGKCHACRINHAADWAVRCQLEAEYWPQSCFLTLTQDDAHLRHTLHGSQTLDPKDLQDFWKRLRITLQRRGYGNIAYYACGEYGSKRGRPHYHAILFGFKPDDLEFVRISYSGHPIYRSSFLESVWKRGIVFVGSVSVDSCGYVARYCQKKIGSVDDDDAYVLFRQRTSGDGVNDPFNEFQRASRNIPYITVDGRYKLGAIGARWFSENWETVARGFLNDREKPSLIRRTPRYFEKLLEEECGIEYLEAIRAARREIAEGHLDQSQILSAALREAENIQEKGFARLERNFDNEE